MTLKNLTKYILNVFLFFNFLVFVGDAKPARACYAVKDLPKNAKVEIEAIAVEEEPSN
jgi:enamine deaminase RidA (YjgF/YER057c/UK114 family)